MELQLVSYEQAKALKELGFPQNHNDNWEIGYNKNGRVCPYSIEDYGGVLECYAPTLELVAKFFRKEKNIHIFITHLNADIYWWEYNMETINDDFLDHGGNYNTYEEALSAGIDKAIEILKKSK